MAFVGLQVPHDIGRLFESVEVPGQREKASDMHVTILFLEDIPVSTVARAMEAAYLVSSRQRPFLLICDSVDSFPANPEYGIPVIAPVISPPLHALHASLKAIFDKVGIAYSNKYPEYKPHVTLSRNMGPDAVPYSAPLPGYCAWVAAEMVIWGGDDGDGKVVVHLPFVLGPGFLGVAASKIASHTLRRFE